MTFIFYLASIGAIALAPVIASPTTSLGKHCVQLDVPVPVVATNHEYMQPRVDSTIDAIDWTVYVTTWTTPNSTDRIIKKIDVNQKFRIRAQLCVPPQKGPKASILQIATTGLGFDKRYFDSEIKPEEYSYVNAAIKKGYSILTYDRLGTGESEKPNAYSLVQIPTEIEILAGLTKIARSGKLLSSSKVISTSSSGTGVSDFIPSKIVQIGHSFGSYLISLMLTKYGSLGDGAILTALYPNTRMVENAIDVLHYDHEFAKEHDPARFSEYGSGYFVLSTKSDLQKLFFQKVSLEPELLTYTEKIKQPETVGEYASEAPNPLSPANDFKGPVQFFIGELDNFICKGDCNNIYDADGARYLYPHGKEPSYYLQPKTGHALTLSTNATAGYEVMFRFLDSNGL